MITANALLSLSGILFLLFLYFTVQLISLYVPTPHMAYTRFRENYKRKNGEHFPLKSFTNLQIITWLFVLAFGSASVLVFIAYQRFV